LDIITILEGISPWWWVAFALALGAVEMATTSFFLIWPALAALCVAGMLAIWPNLYGTAQVSTFAGLGILFTFIGRALMRRYGDFGEETLPDLNQRSRELVGRSAKVLDFSDGQGTIEVDGLRWRALWREGESAAPGDKVRITGANGMILTVGSKAS
jgi:membrane protein implicated in regulation of membrane protease activity